MRLAGQCHCTRLNSYVRHHNGQPPLRASSVISFISMSRTAVLALLGSAVGIFAGNWAWQTYSDQRAQSTMEADRLAHLAEKSSSKGRQREAVRKELSDPASAEFRNERPSVRFPNAWCGEVNARNRFGGMVGFTRYVVELRPEGAKDGHDIAFLEKRAGDSASSTGPDPDKFFEEACSAATASGASASR